MGIRQTEFCSRTTVELELIGEDVKAGLAAYYNSCYYYALMVEQKDGAIFVSMEKHIHDEKIEHEKQQIDCSGKLVLELVSDRENYHFFVKTEHETIAVGKGCCAGLCTEATMTTTFTGVLIGLYANYGTPLFRNFLYQETDEEKN